MHGVESPGIRCLPHFLSSELEAELGDYVAYLFKRELHLDFVGLLRVVPVERTNVDPEPADFQHIIDCLQVFHQVMRRVDEETCRDAVPLFALSAKDLDELARRHRKVVIVWVCHLEQWADVGYFHLSERVCILLQVIEVVDVGMQHELVDLLRGVQNEVGREQAEVTELVAKGFVPAPRELEDQATQPRAR